MDRQFAISPELREKLRIAKEFQESCKQSGGNSRGGRGSRIGPGGRGRADLVSLNSGHGRTTTSQRQAPSATLNTFSASPYTGRQGIGNAFPGNGGLSPEAGRVISSLAATAISFSPATYRETSSNPLPPHARVTQPISVSPSVHIADSHMDNTLRDVTNKCVASGEASIKEPTKRTRVQETRDRQTKPPTGTIQPQQHKHVRDSSNSTDVNMTDAAVGGEKDDNRDDRKYRAATRGHGGIHASIWAQPRTQTTLRATSETFRPMKEEVEGRMENWIPARITHPNPTPARIMAQQSQDEDVNMSGPAPTQAFVQKIDRRSFQGATRLGTSNSSVPQGTGGKGGLADSKWAR